MTTDSKEVAFIATLQHLGTTDVQNADAQGFATFEAAESWLMSQLRTKGGAGTITAQLMYPEDRDEEIVVYRSPETPVWGVIVPVTLGMKPLPGSV